LPADITDEAIDAVTAEPTTEEMTAKLYQETVELKGRLRAQEEVIGGLRGEVSETKRLASEQGSALNELLGHTRDARERGFAYAHDEIWARMDRAVKDADTESYNAAKRELDALHRSRPAPADKKTATADPPKQTQQADPVVGAWFADNPWYNTDTEMRGLADGVYNSLLASEPHTSTTDKLAKVKERVSKRFPDKFPAAARDAPTAVSRPGPQGGRGKPRAKTEADLPPTARAAMDKFVKQGVLTKDQYLKDYQWE
jgi:hypothetical protein